MGGVVRTSRGKSRRSRGRRGPVRCEVSCGELGRCRRVEHDSGFRLVAAMDENGRVLRKELIRTNGQARLGSMEVGVLVSGPLGHIISTHEGK